VEMTLFSKDPLYDRSAPAYMELTDGNIGIYISCEGPLATYPCLALSN